MIVRQGTAVHLDGASSEPRMARFEPRSFDPGWRLLFGVLNTGGHIRFINAQPITQPSEVEDEKNIMFFPERFSAVPRGRLVVSLTRPGRYRPADLMNRKEEFTLRNRRVNTYLLQYNPPGKGRVSGEEVPFRGAITFDRPILAVICDSDLLRDSDGRLGKRRFVYQDTKTRGLEHGDSLVLSEDRHTLEIDWLVVPAAEHGVDQIRVLVDSGFRRKP
jgi:hypothetical protein